MNSFFKKKLIIPLLPVLMLSIFFNNTVSFCIVQKSNKTQTKPYEIVQERPSPSNVIRSAPKTYKGRDLYFMEKSLVDVMNDAGVPFQNGNITNRSYEYQHGTIVYYFIFTDDRTGYEYFYCVDGMDGRIMHSEERHKDEKGDYFIYKQDGHDYANSIANAEIDLGQELISKNIVALIPGASIDNLSIFGIEEDGRKYYKGDIVQDGILYEFKVDAVDGKIVEWNRSHAPEVGAFRINEKDITDYIE